MSLKFTPPQKLISFCTPGWGGGHRKADEHQTSSQWLPSQPQRWGWGRGGGEKKAKWVDSQRCNERERGGRDASTGDTNMTSIDTTMTLMTLMTTMMMTTMMTMMMTAMPMTSTTTATMTTMNTTMMTKSQVRRAQGSRAGSRRPSVSDIFLFAFLFYHLFIRIPFCRTHRVPT